MPRKPRLLVPGAFYHVYSRGNRRQSTYFDDEDRRVFLDRLLRACAQTGAVLVAYCLMSNHFHVLLRPGPTGLPLLMHRVLTAYASWFNRRHAAVGHLFQGRYGSRPLESVGDLLVVLRYVHLNPVAAGMVEVPEHWPWSSHACYISARPPGILATGVDLVLRALGDSPETALAGYRTLLSRPFPREDEVFRRVDARSISTVDASSPIAIEVPSLATLLARVVLEYDVTLADLVGRSRRREFVAARRALALVAARQHGYSLAEIAAHLGRAPQSIHELLSQGRGRRSEAPTPGQRRVT